MVVCSELNLQFEKLSDKENTYVTVTKLLYTLNILAKLEEIIRASDLSNCNKEGECFVHVASGMGQLDVLKYLHSKGADLFRLDENQESGVHWAARQGHGDVIEFLYQHGLSINAPNKAGEAPLHLASKQGHLEAVKFLCHHCTDINESNEEDETALHLASMRGHSEAVRCLIDAGASLNRTDKHGCTALHWAMRRHHNAVAIMLLQSGCNIDILDNVGEAPIHIVCREGLLPIAQTLCAYGCKVEVPNKLGQYPLHIAARSGHTELVRCLCLAGCDVEQKNKDGIAAEIIALAQGYNEMAYLLDKLKNVHLREELISQLIPSTRPIPKIKLKVFGHSGVGKSTFVENIKCGYFTSWFRRSLESMSPKSKKNDSTIKSSFELNSPGSNNSKLEFETCFDTYTRGVDILQANISGIGEISVWEFSGHEPYYMLYDNFIGNTNCLHLVFFSLRDPYEVQEQQVLFWLTFLQSRISVQEPLGYCGRSGRPARVALVATHADGGTCHRVVATGEYVSGESSSVLRAAREQFANVFELHETVFVMDAHEVGSPAMKALKAYIAQHRDKVTQGLPKSTGFLEAVCSQLMSWRRAHSGHSAVEWAEFVDLVHGDVNPLAGEEHLKELVQQMQLMGEVVYIACDSCDVVILDPNWLCGTILGHLLSQENLDRARVTGVYSVDDIQLLFPEADAPKLLLLLEALQLCTGCCSDSDEECNDVEYEFPCFNVVDELEGLWTPSSEYVYGGSKLRCRHPYMLATLFPRLQVNLRRSHKDNADPDCDLYQWYQGSKYSSGQLEGLVTLEDEGESYEIKVRGPLSMNTECFLFLEDLINIAEEMCTSACPDIILERHYLSPSQLQSHSSKVHSYPPLHVLNSLLQSGICGKLANDVTGTTESILSIVFFDSKSITLYDEDLTTPFKKPVPPMMHHSKASHTLWLAPQKPAPAPATMRHSETSHSLGSQSVHQQDIPLQQQRRKSLPHDHTFCSTHSSSCQILLDLYSRLSERAGSSPMLTTLQDDDDASPSVVLMPQLPSSQLSLSGIQDLCAILDPPDSMGRDWCMLGVLLGMTDRLPKLDPGDNPAFSPTACVLLEWMKRPGATLGRLLEKLEELERRDAVDALMKTVPLFRIASTNI